MERRRSWERPRRSCTTTGSSILKTCGTPTTRPCFTPFRISRLTSENGVDIAKEFDNDTTTQILSLFPNFVLQQIQNCIALHLVLPKGPDKTELQWTYIGFGDDDADMTALRLAQA